MCRNEQRKLKITNMHCYNKCSLAQQIPSIKNHTKCSAAKIVAKNILTKKQTKPEPHVKNPWQYGLKTKQTNQMKKESDVLEHLFINEDLWTDVATDGRI